MGYFGEQWDATGKNGDSAGRPDGVDEGHVVAAVDRESAVFVAGAPHGDGGGSLGKRRQ